MITIPASRSTTRHGVSPAMAPDAGTYEGDLGFLAGQGVDVVLLDDPGCAAAMREFQQRYALVWSEDIGGR
jgi:creatinine deaminase